MAKTELSKSLLKRFDRLYSQRQNWETHWQEVADYMIFMDEGKIVERAKTKEFFESPKSERTKLFISQIL